jgi:phage/plasmid primase-like uncharacterized protein
MSDWIRVTRAEPCPICGKDSWCEISGDGAVALCMRVQSDRPKQFKSGETGYIHRLSEAPLREFPQRKKEEPKPLINAESMMKEWAAKTRPEWLYSLAEELGVRTSALMELRVAWAAEHSAFAYPMRNGDGAMVGIRLRNQRGDKWAVKGSKSGIFLPFCIPQKQVWICEGPTDTAAALSLGLFAIGRPSCSGGMPDIIKALRRLHVAEAVLIADNDDPGLNGADMLARHLEIPCCVIVLPAKDVREFVNNGGAVEMLENQIHQTRWITK